MHAIQTALPTDLKCDGGMSSLQLFPSTIADPIQLLFLRATRVKCFNVFAHSADRHFSFRQPSLCKKKPPKEMSLYRIFKGWSSKISWRISLLRSLYCWQISFPFQSFSFHLDSFFLTIKQQRRTMSSLQYYTSTTSLCTLSDNLSRFSTEMIYMVQSIKKTQFVDKKNEDVSFRGSQNWKFVWKIGGSHKLLVLTYHLLPTNRITS